MSVMATSFLAVLLQFPSGDVEVNRLDARQLPTLRGENIVLVSGGIVREATSSRTFGSLNFQGRQMQTLVPFSDVSIDTAQVLSPESNFEFAFKVASEYRIAGTKISPPLQVLEPGMMTPLRMILVNQLGEEWVGDIVRWSAAGATVTPSGILTVYGLKNAAPVRVDAVYFDGKVEHRASQAFVTEPNSDLPQESSEESEKIRVEEETFPFTHVVQKRCYRYKDICVLTEVFTNYGVLKESISLYSTGRLLEILKFNPNGKLKGQFTCSSDGEVVRRIGNFSGTCTTVVAET